MSRASSVGRLTLLVSASAFTFAACAAGDVTLETLGQCSSPPCTVDAGSGTKKKDASSPAPDSGATGDDDTTGDDASSGDDDSSTGNDPDTSGGGSWVDMTNNPAACEQKPGALCGWSPVDNGSGATCACRHGTWAEGWTCEAPNAPTTAGPACPGVVTTDAGAVDANAPDTGSIPDSSTGGSDAGGWVDMENNATACDNKKGVACGWSPTNDGAGYTCACRHGSWADGWTCEPANAPVSAGPSCP